MIVSVSHSALKPCDNRGLEEIFYRSDSFPHPVQLCRMMLGGGDMHIVIDHLVHGEAHVWGTPAYHLAASEDQDDMPREPLAPLFLPGLIILSRACSPVADSIGSRKHENRPFHLPI